MIDNGVYFLPKITKNIRFIHKVGNEEDAKPLFNSLAIHRASGVRSYVELYYPIHSYSHLSHGFREWVFHRNQEPIIKVKREMI